jgi:metallo-beta-lactamase class B
MRIIHIVTLALCLTFTVLAAAPSAQAPDTSRAARMDKERDNAELQKVVPFKVFDNLYYIGVGWVGSWLVTTNQGLIVIDTLDARYGDQVVNNISKLGFKPTDIKYVLILQAHADHLAAVADIQDKYGAKVAMAEGDWAMVAAPPAGRGGPPAFRAPRRDIVVKDGDTLTLGNTTLKLYVTPGHTPGTTSIDMTVFDGGRPYRAFMFGGSAPARGAADQFIATLKRLEGLTKDAQVRIVNHPSSDPEFWDRVDKLARRKPGEPHPFVTPGVFAKWLPELRAEAMQQLEQERQKSQPPTQ